MKKLFKGALASVMCLSMVACSNEKAPEENPTEGVALPAEGTTVSIWHTFTDDQLTTLEAIAKEFNETNEYGITVKVESQTYDGFLDTVKSNVYNGTGPDMILNYPSAAADYVVDEKIVDLSKYINDPVIGIEGYADSKPAGVIAEENAFEDGQQHIIITQQTGPIFFYNKTMYDSLGLQPATTWEEVKSNAEALHAADEKVIGFAIDSITDVSQTLIMQGGSKYIDVDAKEIAFNDETTEKIFEFLGNGCMEGYFSVDPTNGYFSSDMTAGLVGGYIGSVAGLPYVAGKGIFGEGAELAMAPVPMEGTKWTPAWDRGLMVFDYEDADRAVASYLFIKYFTETENSMKWNMAMNSISPYFAVQEKAEFKEYLANNPALNALAQQTPNAGVLPTVTGSATVRTELQDAVKAVAHGEATAAEALAELTENSNAALQD